MSKENVRQFYNRLAEDTAMQERFKEMNARLVEGFNGERPDGNQMDELFRKELLPVAKDAGFEFSLDDLKAYAAEAKETTAGTCCMQRDGELADSEIAAVVGGGMTCACVCGGAGGVNSEKMICIVIGVSTSTVDKMSCVCLIGGYGSY